LEAEAALGRREAVVERYERLREELDDRFGLEPSRDTRQFYRRLLSQGPVDDERTSFRSKRDRAAIRSTT
jgi:DNA-binding SARP family transcriptional activator